MYKNIEDRITNVESIAAYGEAKSNSGVEALEPLYEAKNDIISEPIKGSYSYNESQGHDTPSAIDSGQTLATINTAGTIDATSLDFKDTNNENIENKNVYAQSAVADSGPQSLGSELSSTGPNAPPACYAKPLLIIGDANNDGHFDYLDIAVLGGNYNSETGIATGGDFNFDGQVNFNDLLILAANWGQENLYGDFNGDKTVNFDDLLILAANYNQNIWGHSNGDINFDGIVNFADVEIFSQYYDYYNSGHELPVGAAALAGSLDLNSSPVQTAIDKFIVDTSTEKAVAAESGHESIATASVEGTTFTDIVQHASPIEHDFASKTA